MGRQQYHFDRDYVEEATLGDGTVVRLRVGRPGDRDLLRRGFERLSDESRYLRFMGRKPALSEAELDALTVVDQHRFALAAVRPDPATGEEEGLGVARFVRDPAEPEVAEAAVTVVDAWQGRGLGSLLLRRLAAAARERGVRRFGGEILARNEGMRRLLAEHGAATVVDSYADVLRVQVALPPFGTLMTPPADRGDLLGRMLAQAAGGGMKLRLGDLLLKQR